MPTISYIEHDTHIKYSLVITESEANELSTANPGKAQDIILFETGGSIDFDGNGSARITSSKGQHSYTNSAALVRSARTSLKYGM